MSETLGLLHAVLAGAALVFYFFLGIRLVRRKEERITPGETVVAQAARISMLLLYLSGLILSFNLQRPVAFAHHLASLLPVAVLFAFQFLPALLKKQLSVRATGWMFLCQFIAFVVISLAVFWPV
ncbi:hypothetical protein JW992_01860 [candidate division KSB1 bacterium]|nr:hypothetical protein [candidate division KSB1 bacterium]